MHNTPLTVLIVEDNPIFVELLGEAIRGGGVNNVERHVARDAEDAMRKFRSQAPDITFLDINLPDGSGLDLLDMFLKIAPDAYVVMLTGDAHSESVFRACSSGAQGYILKPFQPKRIHEVIKTYMSSPRAKAPKPVLQPVKIPPVKPKVAAEPEHAPTLGDVLKTWRTLIVSADSDSASDVRLMLNEMGCKTDVCLSGEAGWALLEESHYELVVMDTNLTDVDAYQLANQLRLQNTRQPIKSYVVMLLQPWEEVNKTKADLAGVTHSLPKSKLAEKFEATVVACAGDYQSLMGEAFKR
ncbi:MAG: response regulator [Proteobacteria bacterium]|nr:response regulator [Pseudomonadota bacterium]